jgi:asparagine synthase (glutamine-hydrolysing)
LDERDYKVYLYRDRAGVKPLHYYFRNNVFLFGSELKSLLKHPSFKKSINERAVGLYFKLGYVPSPWTIYKDTYKIHPGHFAVLNLKNKKLDIIQYWNSLDYCQRPKLNISYEEAKQEIKKLLVSCCNYRMVADVPVGVFLSGGFDSSAVTAILQSDRTEKLKTFTIGFRDGVDEAPFAKKTAEFLGTDHYEYNCTSKEAQDIIPELPVYFDEPFADSSSIPTLLVSRLARTQVKVALSADAGDELFAGYNSYISLYNNINFLKKIGLFDHKVVGVMLKKMSSLFNKESFFTQRMHYLGYILTNKSNIRASLLQEGAQSLSTQIFKELVRGIHYPDNLLFYNQELFGDPISVGQAVDYNLVFHNDLLTKVDRAAMAVSLEGREPLVDHRLYEFVSQLPIEYKFEDLNRKKIFKEIVYEYIPEQLINRPKQGFTLPISTWLRGDLVHLLEENLNEKAVARSGFLNSKYVGHLLKLFKNQKLHDEFTIWKIFQFQMWFNTWMK